MDQLHDTSKDVNITADHISADDFKEALEEDHVKGCNIEQFETELEDEDKEPMNDKIHSERFNACDIEKVISEPAEFVELRIFKSLNFFNIINLDWILQSLKLNQSTTIIT